MLCCWCVPDQRGLRCGRGAGGCECVCLSDLAADGRQAVEIAVVGWLCVLGVRARQPSMLGLLAAAGKAHCM